MIVGAGGDLAQLFERMHQVVRIGLRLDTLHILKHDHVTLARQALYA